MERNPLNVVMVTPYWFPVRGGVTTYVSQLSEELRRAFSINVTILAKDGGPQGATILGGGPGKFILRTLRELERLAPDAVHAHGHWYSLAAALLYRRRHSKTKVVFTQHTEFEDLSRIRRWLLRLLLSQPEFFTAVSEDLLGRTLRSVRPHVRTRVVYPGVSVRPAAPGEIETLRETADLLGQGPFIAFVGPLSYERKSEGVAELVRSMKGVRQRFPGAVLLVAGDGRHRKPLEDLADREIPRGSVFLGTVENPAAVFALADVVAHISLQEGLPLAVLEAMAWGRPIVATPAGGIPEVIRDGENGFIVNPRADDIANRLITLLGDSETAQRIANRARADATERFTWATAARRFAELYGQRMPRRVIVSVDLERDYHAGPDSYRGIEEGLPKLLHLFEKHQVVGTFFVTSNLCERFADRLREVFRHGHEIGCHGETHNVAYLASQSYDWQLGSIRRATTRLEDCVGVRPKGFRAPNFSVNGATIRALEACNYSYDTSVLPGRRVVRRRLVEVLDFRNAPCDPYRPDLEDPTVLGESRIVEVPVTENPEMSGGPIGLGFVNMFGAARALEAVNRAIGEFCVLVVHPWELIEPPARRAPEWMRTACTPDPSRLDDFLQGIRKDHEVTTFAAAVNGQRSSRPLAPADV